MTDLTIQHMTVSSSCFLHVVFPKWKIFQFCNTGFICLDRCDQFILFIVIVTDAIGSLNVFLSIDFKRNICQLSGYIVENVFHHTFDLIGQCNRIQEFSLFVDDEFTNRYLVLHFHFLNLSGIFDCECHIIGYQIAMWCKFFMEGISLTHFQIFDHMRCIFGRCPAIYYISIFIRYFQISSIQFYTGCCI